MALWTDLEAMLRDAGEHARRYPTATFLWVDDTFSHTHRLTAGLEVWEIHASDVRACPNEALRKAMQDFRGKEAIIKAVRTLPRAQRQGRRYGNDRPWDFIRDPDDVEPIPHVHPCPECYEYVPCSMDCALEPDLELDDGTPSGSHCICDRCNTLLEAHQGRRRS